jgi:CBS domain-containing protein
MTLLREIAIRHLLTVDPRSSLRRASKVMTDRGVGCAVVIQNETVAGIVTERDILHALANDQDVNETTVEQVMTKNVVSGEPGWEIEQAVRVMSEHGFRHLLVMELNDPVGIVSLRDLMDAMLEASDSAGAQPA